MKIYGITIISSDGNWLVEKNGVKTCAESLTSLFPNKDERLNYAADQMKDLFASFDFEGGMDANGKTENDFQLDLMKGEDICIQGTSEHYTFEFFETEVAWNDINDAGADEHTAKAETEEIPVSDKLPEKSGDVTIMKISDLYKALEESDHKDPTSGYYTSTFSVYAINDTVGTNDSELSNVANLKAVGIEWYRKLKRPAKQPYVHWAVGGIGDHKLLFGGPLSDVYHYSADTYSFYWHCSEGGDVCSRYSHYWNEGVLGNVVYVAVVRR